LSELFLTKVAVPKYVIISLPKFPLPITSIS
jgi:hypothetical protein